MFPFKRDALVGPRWIINFPTKRHWRHPSKLEWVRDGLADLVRFVRQQGIRSVALPPLGCGNGGLSWPLVKAEIESAFLAIPEVEATVYAPTDEYQTAPKRAGVEALTPARALIAGLVRRYAVLGLDCTYLEVQKLAWFLDKAVRRLNLPDPLRLQFVANKYGPYGDNLRHLLNGLDGSYLHCERRLADAGPMDLIWIDYARRDRVEDYLATEAAGYLPALEATAAVIDGFESPLSIEVLATVDWLLSEMGCEPTVAGVRAGLVRWPAGESAARRKGKQFEDHLIELAIERLTAGVAVQSPA